MRIFLIIMLALFLLSCDCFRSYQGVVLDQKTGEPIAGVEIYSSIKKEQLLTRTNDKGEYNGTIIGGLNCAKPRYFFFSKEGFSDTLLIDSGTHLLSR